MSRRTLGYVAAVSALAVASAGASYAIAPREHHTTSASHVAVAPPPLPGAPGIEPGGGPADRRELDRVIAAYERQVHGHPDSLTLDFLGQLYLQRGRLTGDIATYAQADDALTQALRLAPGNTEARDLLAATRYTTHDFAGALSIARALLATTPTDTAALAVAGDAQQELGEYAGARATYARLAVLRPGTPAVEIRLARSAYLAGDVAAARAHADRATALAAHAGLFGPTLAFYDVFRAQLALDTGRYADGLAAAGKALAEAPDWHVAIAIDARALALSGHPRAAVAAYRKAVAIVPQPDYLAALGDLLDLTGDHAGAREQYATVDVVARLARANRQVYNRLVVLFDADHGVDVQDAVRLALAELRLRKDVYGYDAAAWALHAAHRDDEAWRCAAAALRVGTPDPKILYHAGLIRLALHDRACARDLLARALAIGPSFDPRGAPIARAALVAASR